MTALLLTLWTLPWSLGALLLVLLDRPSFHDADGAWCFVARPGGFWWRYCGATKAALTLVTVVLYLTPGYATDRPLRAHEGSHVLWGAAFGPLFPLFFVAYGVAGCVAVLQGKRFWVDNWFERQAHAAAVRASQP